MIEIKAVNPEPRYHSGPIPGQIIEAYHLWRLRIAHYACLDYRRSHDRHERAAVQKAAKEAKDAEHRLKKLLLPHRGVRFRFGKSAVWIDASDIRDRVRIEELP